MQPTTTTLAGKNVLIVEDEYFIAEDLRSTLVRHGATVVGPVNTSAKALALIEANAELDAAILDINLDVESDVYPVAEALRSRGTTFVFATGYDSSQIRSDFSHVPRFEKPFDYSKIVLALR